MNPKQHLLASFFVLFAAPIFAQNTGGFNYQAVLRHNDFTPYSNQNIQVFLNILNAPSSGTLLFSESHANIQTDVLGQFNLVIGLGTPTFNLFSGIDWASGPRFLDVVVNVNGTFTSLGITQFISVPYAKVAEKSLFSGPPSGAATMDLSGNYPGPTVVGLQNRAVSDVPPMPGNVLKWNSATSKWEPSTDLQGGGGPTYSAGNGINISPSNVISNTGDLDATDDLTINSQAGGDVNGPFSNLKLKNDVVGSAQIINGSIQPADLAFSLPTIPTTLPPSGAASGDLAGNYPAPTIANLQGQPLDVLTGSANGRVLKFLNGKWQPADDNGGTGGDNWGTQTAVVGTGLSGNGTPGSPILNTGDTNSSDDLTTISTAGGDASGLFSNLSVNKLKGVAISATPPTGGKVLKFNGSQWEPADDNGGTGGDNWGVQTAVVGTGLSGNGTSGSPILNTGDTNSSDDLTTISTAGGDASGLFSNLSVNKLKGVAISATPPTGGKVLKFNGTQWEPADDNGGTGGDNWGVQTAIVGTGLSGNGTSGSPILNTGDTNSSDDLTTNSTAGGDVSGPFSNLQLTVGTAEVTDGSLTAADLAAGVIPSSLPPNGAAGGDLSGTFPNPTVDGLQGKTISPTAPTDGQVLKFSNANNQWQPDTDNAGSGGGTLAGEVTGPAGNNTVARLKGRKIGGMQPQGNQVRTLVYRPDSQEWDDFAGDLDYNSDTTQVVVARLKGRKIGGMQPQGNQVRTFVYNPDDQEWDDYPGDFEVQNNQIQLASIQGRPVDLTGAGPGMALTCVNGANGLEFHCVPGGGGFSLPFSETGAFNVPMLDLKNTNSATQNGVRFDNTGRYGVRAISREGQAGFSFDAATVNTNFTYPAAVFGEQINTGNSGVGVFGKAVSSVNDQEGNGVIGLGKSNGVLGMVIGNNGRAGVTGVAIAPATVGGRFIGHLTLQNGQFQFINNVVSMGNLNVIERTGNGVIEVGGNWTSNANGVDNLGSSTKRWNTVFATNGTINTSDAREKQAIEPVNYGLAEVMQLRPVSFEWKSSPQTGRKLGFLAQDLQPILPEVVSDREWSRDENNRLAAKPAERLGVFYSDIIPVLARAIQEQQAMIQKKEAELEAVKLKLESLEMRLERLEKNRH